MTEPKAASQRVEAPQRCPKCGSDDRARRDCEVPLPTKDNLAGFHATNPFCCNACTDPWHGESVGGTVGLDDTRRCCNVPECGNDWPCAEHPESVAPATFNNAAKAIRDGLTWNERAKPTITDIEVILMRELAGESVAPAKRGWMGACWQFDAGDEDAPEDMMIDPVAAREEFHACLRSKAFKEFASRKPNGDYKSDFVDALWRGWKYCLEWEMGRIVAYEPSAKGNGAEGE